MGEKWRGKKDGKGRSGVEEKERKRNGTIWQKNRRNTVILTKFWNLGLLYQFLNQSNPNMTCESKRKSVMCQISHRLVYFIARKGRKTLNFTIFSTSTFSAGGVEGGCTTIKLPLHKDLKTSKLFLYSNVFMLKSSSQM